MMEVKRLKNNISSLSGKNDLMKQFSLELVEKHLTKGKGTFYAFERLIRDVALEYISAACNMEK